MILKTYTVCQFFSIIFNLISYNLISLLPRILNPSTRVAQNRSRNLKLALTAVHVEISREGNNTS